MPLTLKISSAKQLSRLLGIVSIAAFFNSEMPQTLYAQEVELDFLCQRFPLNSLCEGYKPKIQQERTNPKQQQESPSKSEANQIIKVRLELSGPDDEWIQMKTSDNGTGGTVFAAYHTKRVKRTLLSNLTTGILTFGAEQLASEAIDGYDGPVPLPDINFYRWVDHETRRIVFVPDGCSKNSPIPLGNGQQPGQSSCVITGTKFISLPAGTDIRAGLLTIEYAEEELVRTITFKVPQKDS